MSSNKTEKNTCTLSPDGSWSICCLRHDKQYTEQKENKFSIDADFAICIFKKIKEDPIEIILSLFTWFCLGIWTAFSVAVAIFIAFLVWLGVSTVGWMFWWKSKRNKESG